MAQAAAPTKAPAAAPSATTADAKTFGPRRYCHGRFRGGPCWYPRGLPWSFAGSYYNGYGPYYYYDLDDFYFVNTTNWGFLGRPYTHYVPLGYFGPGPFPPGF